MQGLFDTNPELRSEDEWRRLLTKLLDSLSQYSGVRFEATSWYTYDDTPGYASSGNCVNIRGAINSALTLDCCGVLCITINFGEAVCVSCDLLLFSSGRRINDHEVIVLSYREDGWVTHGWTSDETGEWEAHTTDARWKVTEINRET